MREPHFVVYMKKTAKYLLITVLSLMLGCCLFGWIYISDYYHADADALEVINNPSEGISVQEEKDTYIAFIPEEPTAGLIFYPGGKVQYESYAPLMEACAGKGILTVLVHVPANLAILDRNAADGYEEMFPEITDWYIGGHSLGGVAAAMYLEDREDEFKGVVFLAAYPTVDLSETDLKALSLHGSEDGVLNLEKYEASKRNLPADFKEAVIEGGCHAYFGSYGRQKGDGEPKITSREQINETADLIGRFAADA